MLIALFDLVATTYRRSREEDGHAYSRRNRRTDTAAVSPAQRSRAIRHRAGSLRTKDRPLARYICDYLRVCAQSRIDAGRRHGRSFGTVVLGSNWGNHQRSAARDDRLHDHGNRGCRLWLAGPGIDAHGLWVAWSQVGPVVPAHDCLDLLVCLSDRGGLPRRRGDTRPLDRDAAFTGR